MFASQNLAINDYLHTDLAMFFFFSKADLHINCVLVFFSPYLTIFFPLLNYPYLLTVTSYPASPFESLLRCLFENFRPGFNTFFFFLLTNLTY